MFTVTMIILYVLLGLLAVWILFATKRRKRSGKPIPAPKGLPLIGNGFAIDPAKFYVNLAHFAERYGEIVQLKVFNTILISLNTADLIRTAFNNEPYKRFMNDRPITFWGNYVLHGQKSIGLYTKPYKGAHGDLRKGLTKALHVYGDGIKEFEDKIANELQRLHKTLDAKEGRDFEMVAVIKRSLSNVLSCLLIGEDLQDNDDDVDLFWQLNDLGDNFVNAGTNSILLAFPFLVKVPGFYKKIYDEGICARRRIVTKYFTRIKNTHVPGVNRGIVDFLLDEQTRDTEAGRDVVFTDERIINTILELAAAALLTSLATITSTILCLMHHPEYQGRVQQELDEVICPNRMPCLDERAECPLLEAIITESGRYVTVVPLMIPHECEPETEFEGYHIPAGSVILPNIWHVHHNPAVWGDPWTFRPERWLDEQGHVLPSNHPLRKHLLSFGTGRRQCVGEQFGRSRLFLYLASLLKTYTFTPTPGKCGSCDPREGSFEGSTVLRPKPYYCTALRRN